jgi:NADH-quinone oxidoreductase subunit K
MPTLSAYLCAAGALFWIALAGLLLNRRNVIVILMCVEMMLMAVSLHFVAFSVFRRDIGGQVFALMILAVGAAEAAVGLALLVIAFRNRGSIALDDLRGRED